MRKLGKNYVTWLKSHRCDVMEAKFDPSTLTPSLHVKLSQYTATEYYSKKSFILEPSVSIKKSFNIFNRLQESYEI